MDILIQQITKTYNGLKGDIIKNTAVLLFILLTGCKTVTLDSHQAYLIVDAQTTETSEHQPTWIALLSSRSHTHLPTHQPIQSIDSGRYTISHIDFQKSKHSGRGTAFSRDGRSRRIKIGPGVIYYLGMIELDRTNHGTSTYTVKIFPEEQLIDRACASRPDLFASHPVRFVYGEYPEKDYTIDCGSSARPGL